MISERELIRRIGRQAGGPPPSGEVGANGRQGLPPFPVGSLLLRGIGDDCAVWRPAAGDLVTLISTDTLVEKVHFDLSWHPPGLLGRKAVAVNLSDIAAMGATPRFVLLSLGLRGSEVPEWRDQLLNGFNDAVEAAGTLLIGGDTIHNPAGLMLSVTVIGEAPEGEVCYRQGGRTGDSVWVGGALGLAAAGLHLCRRGLSGEERWREAVAAHLDPQAQIELGRALASSGLVGAMMDLSDGLAGDLSQICEAGGVGAELILEELPIPPLVVEAAELCRADPLSWAISGGEDYHLLFTSPGENDQAIEELGADIPGIDLHRVGQLTPRKGVIVRDGRGESRDVSNLSYDHFS